MSYPWFRLYNEIRSDPKMLALTDSQFRAWINLLCLASESSHRGTVTVYDYEGLYRALGLSPEAELGNDAGCLATFESLDLVRTDYGDHPAANPVIIIAHWVDRQYDNPSDQPHVTRERKRRSRGAESIATESRDVTTCHDDVTTGHDTDTDTDTEGDRRPETGADSTESAEPLEADEEPESSEVTTVEAFFSAVAPDVAPEPLPPLVPPRLERRFLPGSPPYDLALRLLEGLKRNHPQIRTFPKPNSDRFQAWCRHVDLMVRRDGYPPGEIEQVIDFATTDTFWIPIILSTDNLRKKYITLQAQMGHRRPGSNGRGSGNGHARGSGTGQTWDAAAAAARYDHAVVYSNSS